MICHFFLLENLNFLFENFLMNKLSQDEETTKSKILLFIYVIRNFFSFFSKSEIIKLIDIIRINAIRNTYK